MRRCDRNVALILGTILLASNTFSNSCSLMTLETYAAEDAPTSPETAAHLHSLKDNFEQMLIFTDVTRHFAEVSTQTEEETVETELPTEKTFTAAEPPTEEQKNTNHLEYEDYHVLLKIVEAEAGSEDIIGKMLVANVIMNRVQSTEFPDTVTDVVYQRYRGTAQFSPTSDGRIDKVCISDETVLAVERVLEGEDHSMGALYFRSVHCDSHWHDQHLIRILEHGNHIFYTT